MCVCDHILVIEKKPLMLGLKELWTGNIPYFHLKDDTEAKKCIENYELPVFPARLRPLGIDSSMVEAMCRACWERPGRQSTMQGIVEGLHELDSSRLSSSLVSDPILMYAIYRKFLCSFPLANTARTSNASSFGSIRVPCHSYCRRKGVCS